MAVSLFAAILLAIGQTSQPGVNKSKTHSKLLERAFLQRAEFKTGRFALRVEEQSRDLAPYVETLDVRMANEDWLIRNVGDDHGMVSPPMEGQMNEGAAIGGVRAFSPISYFLNWSTKDNFTYQDGAQTADFSEGRPMPMYVDLRTYGLRAIVPQRKDPRDMFDMMVASQSIEYEERPQGKGIVLVVGVDKKKLMDGRWFDYEWDIDETKGPAVLASREYLNYPNGRRELAAETRNVLMEVDKRWWPIEVETTVHMSGRHYKVQVQNAEFDRPEHPTTLSPDDLGLPIGLPIRKMGSAANFYYAGAGSIMDEPTFEANKANFDLAPLAAFKAKARAIGYGQFPAWWDSTDGTYGLKDVADRPDLWDLYVRRWVIKRMPNLVTNVVEPLTDEQRTAAQGVLDDCRKQARPVRAKLDVQLAKLSQEILTQERALGISPTAAESPTVPASSAKDSADKDKATKSNESFSGKDAVRRLAALRERRAALEHSPEMQRLFDELNRRLEGLLTSAQRDPNSITRRMPPPLPPVKIRKK